MSPTTQPRVWFITGASSGLGFAVTKRVLDSGDIAIATLRNPSDLAEFAKKYSVGQLLVLKADVTNENEVAAAFARAKAVFGRIDVVYNNAGFWMRSEVEGTTDADARRLFEVNFWGALSVSREAIKFFRESNPRGHGGHLLQVSSMVGVNPWPLTGLYSSTKFALEGVTDALKKELDPAWNIKITIIEPGVFGTRALYDESGAPKPIHPAYTSETSPTKILRDIIATPNHPAIGQMGDPDKAAREIHRLAALSQPPYRLPLGKDAIQVIREKLQAQLKEVDGFESWSSDLV